MTTIEAAAALAGTVLVKGTIVAAGALIAGRFVARSAANAGVILGLGALALGAIVVVGPLVPQLGSGYVAIPHESFRDVSIGVAAVSPALMLLTIWVAGVVLLLSRFGRDLHSAHRLVARAHVGWNRTDELLAAAARAVGYRRLPDIRETSELATAALVGFRRPVLLVPRQARDWSDDELFGVLCHELEHARRHDWLMLMVDRIVTALFWINPLVHLMARRAAAAREFAADAAAIRAGVSASAYASRLIAVAKELRAAPRMAVSVAFAEGAGVEPRVRALFNRRTRRNARRISTARMILAGAPLVAGLAVVQPFACIASTAAVLESCP